jgi:predicted transcriptional regulator
MGLEFDLLGDPINPKHGQPGRNEHVPTAANASKIRTLLIAGMPVGRIAQEIGLSAPTLRRHYFQSGKINRELAREMALAEARAKNFLQIQAAADDGNVSAMKEMRQVLERMVMEDQARKFGDKKKAKKPALGKKEQAKVDAVAPVRDGTWSFLDGSNGTGEIH